MLEGAACWLIGLWCQAAALDKPTAAVVQAAYEREAAAGSAKHDRNLEIVSLDCSTMTADGEHLCWVTFTSKADTARQLYFDVASVAYSGGNWVLRSGLCKPR